MCSSGLGWVSQAPKPETLALPICESCEEEVGVGKLPQCAKQPRAERIDRRLNVAPTLLEKDPFPAQTSQGPWQRLTFLSCSSVCSESGSTSLALTKLPCYCLGSVVLTLKEDQLG